MFEVRNTLKCGMLCTVFFVFDEKNRALDIIATPFARIESPLKRDELHRLVNEINDTYRYPKVVVTSDGTVCGQYAVRLSEAAFAPDMICFLGSTLLKTADDEHEKFMKLQYL